jgi:ribosomal protein L11 methyltransferase
VKYTELNIIIPPEFPDGREIAIALLDADNFDTFLETDTGIITYAESESFSMERLLEHPLFSPDGEFRFRLITKLVPEKNWNKIWEESFLPVIIDNMVMVRAPFHEAIEGITHEIIIEPRMAFGTGHHETTELMIRQMIRQNFAGKRTLRNTRHRCLETWFHRNHRGRQ